MSKALELPQLNQPFGILGRSMRIQTVITAAGDSRARFLEAGFQVPKNLIKVGPKLVIEQAIESYVMDYSNFQVALNDQESRDCGTDIAVKQLFPSARLVYVPSSARGALASALMCSASLNLEEPLLIAAGDSRIDGGIEDYVRELYERKVEGGTLVFESSGSRWSYVSTDGFGRVIEVSEKYQIGGLATTGVFYFRKAENFIKGAEWVLRNNAQVNGRFFVSTVMNFLICQNQHVGYIEIPPGSYKSWSTPADFISLEEK